MENTEKSKGNVPFCPTIFVVSGGKGLSGINVVRSVLIQFPQHKCPLKLVPDVNSKQMIQETVERVKSKKGVIVHTMVDPDMRRELGLSADDDYVNPRKVRMELDYAHTIFERGGFYTIKVTHRPIETSANEIISVLNERFDGDNIRLSH